MFCEDMDVNGTNAQLVSDIFQATGGDAAGNGSWLKLQSHTAYGNSEVHVDPATIAFFVAAATESANSVKAHMFPTLDVSPNTIRDLTEWRGFEPLWNANSWSAGGNNNDWLKHALDYVAADDGVFNLGAMFLLGAELKAGAETVSEFIDNSGLYKLGLDAGVFHIRMQAIAIRAQSPGFFEDPFAVPGLEPEDTYTVSLSNSIQISWDPFDTSNPPPVPTRPAPTMPSVIVQGVNFMDAHGYTGTITDTLEFSFVGVPGIQVVDLFYAGFGQVGFNYNGPSGTAIARLRNAYGVSDPFFVVIL